MNTMWYFVNIGRGVSGYTEDELHELSTAYYKQRMLRHIPSMFYNTYWLGVL